MTGAVSPLTIGLLLLVPSTIAVGQILFKLTSEKLASADAPLYTVAFNPVFILAMVIYGSATLLWLYVLKNVPLMYAYPFMALSFVIVPLLAMFFLGESISIKYAIGTALIIGGLIIGQS